MHLSALVHSEEKVLRACMEISISDHSSGMLGFYTLNISGHQWRIKIFTIGWGGGILVKKVGERESGGLDFALSSTCVFE